MKAKLGVHSVEKDVANQTLAQEKVGQSNAELALAKEKKQRAQEPSKLAAVKEEAKAELKNKAFETIVEYAMRC